MLRVDSIEWNHFTLPGGEWLFLFHDNPRRMPNSMVVRDLQVLLPDDPKERGTGGVAQEVLR